MSAGMHQGFPVTDNTISPGQPQHSRQASGSFDASAFDSRGSIGSTAPISRPTPIRRPASTVQGQRGHELPNDIDLMSQQLGSSRLLDDSDELLPDNLNPGQRRGQTTAPGATRIPQFAPSPFMDTPFGSSPLGGGWGQPTGLPFSSPPPGLVSAAWSNNQFGPPPAPMRGAQPRSVALRQLLIRSCIELEPYAADQNGFIDLSAISGHVRSLEPPVVQPASDAEIREMCDTEGNPHNGGGSFITMEDDNGKTRVRFEADAGVNPYTRRDIGAPGQMRSPIVGAGGPHQQQS
jgi:hypothetical protein